MDCIWQERAHYGHFFYRIPHGESAADVYDRVSSFNESLFRQFEQDDFPNVLVLVTHGIWARAFLMKWFRWTYEEFESLRNIPHCQFLIMKQNESKKYHLKTRLLTWDDSPDDEIDEEITKEVGEEIKFNSKNKLLNPDDFDIHSIIEAQRNAIKQNRVKNRNIKDAYAKISANGGYQSKFSTKFKSDNMANGQNSEAAADDLKSEVVVERVSRATLSS